jgi:signal transduction histidine kinase/CheY-like chemotaxis protein
MPETPIRARYSLRWRLPLLIASLIAIVLGVFLWVASRTIKATLIRAGAVRAHAEAVQIADLLDGSAASLRLQQLGRNAQLQAYLRTRSLEAKRAAEKELRALAQTGPRRVELRDANGAVALAMSIPDANGHALPAISRGDREPTAGIGPLKSSDGVVYYDAITPIRDADTLPDAAGEAEAILGSVIIRSALTVTPPGIIGRLVGNRAMVAVGNRDGGVWTDFSGVVPAPPLAQARQGVTQYQRADGQTYLGAVAPVRGTPLDAWVALSLSDVVAPADAFLARLVLIALACVGIGALVAALLTRSLTAPLAALSRTADAIAVGNLAPRVTIDRQDELGRLGRAFNAMADEIAASHDRLEARVAERTSELAAARLEAERANRAKSAFLSGMSHDLRTPLNAILGFAQLLEIDSAGTDRAEPVRQILSGGQHLLDLITEVLDITRIESGQLALSPEPVAVHDVVQRAVELVTPLATQRGIGMHIESIASDDTVRGDRQRVSQILLNLLSNAVKYNRPNGRIVIGVQRLPPARYRITVADTGPGIPESKLSLLFEPFERLGAEQTAVEGTGLGLALSRALAEAMDGTIGVRSVVDEGSTFWIELNEAKPQRDRDPAAASTDLGAVRDPIGRGVVLYVEDNLSNVRLMERILGRRPGVELLHAADATAGLALMEARRPDLVLMDMHLPGLSGEEALQQLWADPVKRHVPIVIVTADATPGLARRLKAAGATACLTKPLNVKEVLQLVDNLLNAEPRAGEHV